MALAGQTIQMCVCVCVCVCVCTAVVELTSQLETSVNEGESSSIEVCLTVTEVLESFIHRAYPVELTPFGSAKGKK